MKKKLAAEMRQWVVDCCYGAQTKYRADMAQDVWAWSKRLDPGGGDLVEEGLDQPLRIGRTIGGRLKTTQEKRDDEMRAALQKVLDMFPGGGK